MLNIIKANLNPSILTTMIFHNNQVQNVLLYSAKKLYSKQLNDLWRHI